MKQPISKNSTPGHDIEHNFASRGAVERLNGASGVIRAPSSHGPGTPPRKGSDPHWMEMRKVILSQLRDSLHDLESTPQISPEKAIHNFRKANKQIRAILRLVPKQPGQKSLGFAGVPEKSVERLKSILRALSRFATPVRDLHVQIKLLERLQKKIDGLAPAKLCQFLEQRCRLQLQILGPVQPRIISGLKTALEAVPERLETPLAIHDLKRAWKKAKTKTAKACRRATSTPSDTCLHEWRKRAKSLWLMTEHLHVAGLVRKKGMTDHLKVLTDRLGDDRDLAMLERTLSQISSRAKKRVKDLIQKKRSKLQSKVLRCH